MEQQRIIMNYTVAPGIEEIEALAAETLKNVPEELTEFCENLAITVEEFPDEATESELDLEDSYDLVTFFRSGKEISPGVERKSANDDDVLTIYRRPLLDMWCESGDDITDLVRQYIIEELGKNFEFSEDEVDEMISRHYQGML